MEGPLLKTEPGSNAVQDRTERVSRSLAQAARRLNFSSAGKAALPGSYRARREKLLSRLITVGGFVSLVLVPSLTALVYYGAIASDQYAAEARFAVRSGALAGLDSLSAMTGIPSIQIIQDTQVVTDYALSRAMVERLQETADVKRLYSRPEADFYARLSPNKPIEKIVKYWKSMVAIGIEMPGGIVNVAVRAFRPEDAVAITNAVVDASESLINGMNDRARQDAVTNAERRFEAAGQRLSQARANLEIARNREGTLDATSQAKKTSELISAVRAQQLEMLQVFESTQRTVSRDAPQIRNLQLQIEAADKQIARLQAELTSTGPAAEGASTLAASITRLASLELDRQVAETQYTAAATVLERARASSLSKQIYLTSFVRPVMAEESRYPRRLLSVLAVLVVGILSWGIFVGLASVARKHFA